MSAISVRQPWAWALIHGGKNIENRGRMPPGTLGLIGRRVFIHAAKGMTRAEYEDAHAFMASIGVDCPPPDQLLRGGLIGTVRLADVTAKSDSPWFFGPVGLVCEDPAPFGPVPGPGQLGWFNFEEGGAFDPPKTWMRAWKAGT